MHNRLDDFRSIVHNLKMKCLTKNEFNKVNDGLYVIGGDCCLFKVSGRGIDGVNVR